MAQRLENITNTHRSGDWAPKHPIRGSLRLEIRASSPQITAGNDFSIFVIIQNPFDVPITIYQVQTHIPVEFVDVNQLLLEKARRVAEHQNLLWYQRFMMFVTTLFHRKHTYAGVAQAVGTNFNPFETTEWLNQQVVIASHEQSTVINGDLSVSGIHLTFPNNPTSEELDQLFQRIKNYQTGAVPVTLQPGNAIVKQFVLRTRKWLFFTPLTHHFQIQVNYSSDGKDHANTIAYDQHIQSTLGATVIGALAGAVIGSILKTLTSPTMHSTRDSLQAIIISVLASVIVIIAFARKSTAQPIVSVEDFWGGMLIGFSTGFLGFEQFSSLFST